MKAILAFYLKLFIVSSFLFGLLAGLIDILGPETIDINRSLKKALLFGSLMSLFLGTIHIIALKRLGLKSITSGDLGVNQHRRVTSNLHFTQLITKLKSIPFTEKMEMSDSGKSVTIHTGASWKSWGEKIKIEVLRETESETEYEIVSQPKLRSTLVDNGRNLQNVIKIEQLIS